MGGWSSGASPSGSAAILAGASITGGLGGASATRFLGPSGIASSGTVASAGWIATRAGTLRNLRISCDLAHDADDSTTFTVMVNDVATGIVATRGNSVAGNAITSNTANSAAVAAGDRITIRSVNAASGPAAGIVGYSWSLDLA